MARPQSLRFAILGMLVFAFALSGCGSNHADGRPAHNGSSGVGVSVTPARGSEVATPESVRPIEEGTNTTVSPLAKPISLFGKLSFPLYEEWTGAVRDETNSVWKVNADCTPGTINADCPQVMIVDLDRGYGREHFGRSRDNTAVMATALEQLCPSSPTPTSQALMSISGELASYVQCDTGRGEGNYGYVWYVRAKGLLILANDGNDGLPTGVRRARAALGKTDWQK